MKKCLVIGAAMLDIVMQIDKLPQTGEDVCVKNQEMTVGGCAYNAADIMNHFNIDFTLFAPLGTGAYADIIRRKLQEKGHASLLEVNEKDNGYCLCMVEADGERTFLTLPGVECSFKREWFNSLNTDEYDSAYICGYQLEREDGSDIIDFLENNRNLKVYYAPGPRISYIPKEFTQRILALNPVIHLNEDEAKFFASEDNISKAADKIFEMCSNSVVITLGDKGAYLKNENYSGLIQGIKAQVKDTIGAGDSHIGAFISLKKLGYDEKDCVKYANKVSSLVVSTKGPTLNKDAFNKGEITND